MDFSEAIKLNTRKYGYIADTENETPEIREFLNSEGITNLIRQICEKYGLGANVQYDIIQLIVWYVSKQISEQEFVNFLSMAPLQAKFLSLFLQDLQEKLWDPYDAALNQAKIPYKLLTKLNPEPQEKVQQWLESVAKQYPEQQDDEEDFDALISQQTQLEKARQDFSLGDQIKIFANQTAAQSLAQPQEIKIAVPDTSFTPAQNQAAKPIEITVNQPQVTQTQQPITQAKTIEQPAAQVRLEISSSPVAPQIPETVQPESKPQEQPATFSLPSMRFQPLLQKQEDMIPKQATPSAVLQEAMGSKEPNQTQMTQPTEMPEAKKQESPKQPAQPTGNVIDLTNWNVTQ